MNIDKRLNLVVPIERDDGTNLYIHSTPISYEVFEKYFLVISKTFAGIYSEGLNVLAGPKIAAIMLKRIAQELGLWDGEEGVGSGLMSEIRRLSNVLCLTDGKWQPLPLETALNRGLIGEDDFREAEGAIVFFICISAMHKRSLVESTLNGMCDLWGLQTTSLNCSEYGNLLPTLTETDNSGEKVTLSAIPS